jgi:hypothetical protein
MNMSQPTGTQSGATGTGTGVQSDDGQQDPNRTGQTAEGSTGDGTQSGDGNQTGTQNAVTREEYEAVQRRMQAADKRASDLEAKLTAEQRAKMDEHERTKAELADAKTAMETMKTQLSQAQMEVAFLKDNSHKWKNPAAALKLADLSGVEVTEDGTVKGLKQALDALAKSDAYLLDAETDDGTNKDDKNKGGAGRTGIHPQNGQTGSNARADLEKKFPGLRGRV